jgi:hypothetical protein
LTASSGSSAGVAFTPLAEAERAVQGEIEAVGFKHLA